MRTSAAADLSLVVRFLPDIVPRSPALVRVASYTSGPSATALDGRPDRIDAGRGFGFVDGTIKHVNDLLAPRGWRVQTASKDDGRAGWYSLRQVGA